MTGFLVTSPFTKDVLVRRKLVSKPILVVPPALCLSPSGKKTEAAGFRGLMVSNLIRRKGILEFLEEPGRRLLRGDRFGIKVAGRFDIEPCYAEACLGIEVHSFRVAILATMNYRSMRFHPQEEEDLEYVGLYERHMRRRQDFGFAMGPGCSDIVITGLEEMGYEVRSGKSICIITSADREMLRFMLTFMCGAISEMLATPAELAGLGRRDHSSTEGDRPRGFSWQAAKGRRESSFTARKYPDFCQP